MALDEDLGRIKAKISKLLKLAEGSGNEHEAANAMGKARALMDKYQLDKIDIIEVDGVSRAFKEAQATRAFKACPAHIQWLTVGVGKFNDCQAQFQHGHPIDFKANAKRVYSEGKIIVFRGYSLDVDLCIEMFTRLTGAINRLCGEYLQSIGHEGRYPMGIGNAYKRGAVSTILRRLDALKIERQKITTAKGTSLVVVKENAVAEHFGSAKYKSEKERKMDSTTFLAFLEGQKDGERVEIQKSVEA